MSSRKKLLILLLPKSSYRNEAFLQAARQLNIEVIAVQNRCHVLAQSWAGDSLLALPFDKPEEMAEEILSLYGDRVIDAVLGVDDIATVAAQRLANLLSISGNHITSAEQLTNKYSLRKIQQQLKLPVPKITLLEFESCPEDFNKSFYPLIVKPVNLSASQGVIRVENKNELLNAIDRIQGIFRSENVLQKNRQILVEEYLPGREAALEAIIQNGQLKVLAIFDKPEPLEGPYFEETIYISPSNLSASLQDDLVSQVVRVCNHAGWVDGPVHAEARINENTVTLLEVAPRTIGGRCSRSLNYQLGISLEELVLRNALNEPLPDLETNSAIGVCMLPVPYEGLFESVSGRDKALELPVIKEVIITAVEGDSMAPLPEGNQYIGFIIAEGENAKAVQSALMKARSDLHIHLKPLIDLKIASVIES